MTIKLAGLWLYPVKSMRGVAIQEANIGEKGLFIERGQARFYDREWAVVQESGKVLTQRQAPQMATMQVAIDEDGLTLSQKSSGESILVSDGAITDTLVRTHVFADTCGGFVADDGINQWLTTQLAWHRPLRLVRYQKNTPRLPGYPQRFGESATHFADAAPYLLANLNSLRKLNDELKKCRDKPVDIQRFRPNIVIDGLPAFYEHHKAHIHVSNGQKKTVTFRLVDHCQRCSIITLDPLSGKKCGTPSLFKTLSQLNAMPDNIKAPAFGVNACVDACHETMNIRVGDTIAR